MNPRYFKGADEPTETLTGRAVLAEPVTIGRGAVKHELPAGLPELPPVPEGFDRWEYRGLGVRGLSSYAYLCDAYGVIKWAVDTQGVPSIGIGQYHYLEAVRAEAGPSKEQEEAAADDWLTRTCPSGDAESVHEQWLKSSDYADLFEEAPAPDAPGERHSIPADRCHPRALGMMLRSLAWDKPRGEEPWRTMMEVGFALEEIALTAPGDPAEGTPDPFPPLDRRPWNRRLRDSVDSLLAEAGYQPDSSARHQLSMMDFESPEDDWQRRALAAEGDTRRLDWLEAHPFMAYRQRDPGDDTISDHFTLVDEDDGAKNGRRGIVKPTLRDAIDAALTQPATKDAP